MCIRDRIESRQKKDDLEAKLAIAKKTAQLSLAMCSLTQIPLKVLTLSEIRILDLSFNSIEHLPDGIGNLTRIERLALNNNPLQYLPIELSNLTTLKVLELSNTQIKFLPREMALLKDRLYELNLRGCPLKPKLQEAYDRGITFIFIYLQRKFDRSFYRVNYVFYSFELY
eukprot:TRINITY_DN11860_c0_g1_i1.p1 TRINITY_DN11860_c0_g1~~TRINITY_DN11860_c0_g1_i1.p1  ORF type:complete len:189 (-),score=29.10 TRINITY_DN11860_c0_g1_i1:244-753(-)